MKGMSYTTFFAMAAVSFVIMYGVMFLNVDETSQIFLSVNRTYMALLMTLPMQVMMILVMGKMYPSKKTNALIAASGVVAFILVLIGLRTQHFISDREYMKGMIPHHSSAIMTSKNASLHNPKVRELARQIIESQEREITEMRTLLKEIDK